MYHETTTEGNSAVEVIIAESVRELTTAVDEANRTHPHPIVQEADNRRFYGRRFSSWEDIVAATAEPWADGLAVVERMLADLDGADLPKPVSRRRKLRFTEDAGDELDYDRLRDGRDFWRSAPRATSRGPSTITIVADIRARCSIDHRDILWRGAAAVALTYLLEQAGYSVELWAAQAEQAAFSNGDMFLAVCLKQAGDPVDLGALAAGVSAWFYRTVGFSAANLVHNRRPTSFAGYDRPEGVHPFLDRLNGDQNKVVVENVWSHAAACQLIRDTIARLASEANA